MSKAEKYLPYILSVMLPGLNMLSNNPFDKALKWEVVFSKWLIASSFLYCLWLVNEQVFSKKMEPWRQKSGQANLVAGANISFILLFYVFDYLVLTKVISLTKVLPIWAVMPRFAMAAVIFAMILKVFQTIREKEALTVILVIDKPTLPPTRTISLVFHSICLQIACKQKSFYRNKSASY